MVVTIPTRRGRERVEVVQRLVSPSDEEILVLDAWWRTRCSGAIHQSAHGLPDADRFRVRGFIEEGSATPFDMAVRNQARQSNVMDAPNNARRTPPRAHELKRWRDAKLARLEPYVVAHSQHMPQVRDWTLSGVDDGG